MGVSSYCVSNFVFCDFLARFYDMKNTADTYYVTVIVDKKLDKIIGSGTILREKKFIHECGSVIQHQGRNTNSYLLLICRFVSHFQKGIIEDIIVNNTYRGKQLGKIIIASLIEIGKAIGCYKITLNCKDDLIKFYNQFGLVCENGNANFMQVRIPSKL